MSNWVCQGLFTAYQYSASDTQKGYDLHSEISCNMSCVDSFPCLTSIHK